MGKIVYNDNTNNDLLYQTFAEILVNVVNKEDTDEKTDDRIS